MKYKILVTGSEGFLGKHLVNKLEKLGHQVVGLDKKLGADLSKWDSVSELDENFDYVYHLAAYNGTKWFYERPVEVIRDNFFPTEYIFKKFSGKVKKIVFAGTCESYVGSTEFFNYPIPTDENVPLSIVDPKNVRWSYGASKLLNEVMVWAYAKQYNQNFAIIRFHNIYGPGQVDHFIPDFIERALAGKYELNGYNNTRSFMYVDDAIEATIKTCFSDEANVTIHIGNDEEVTIKHVAEIILKLLKVSHSNLVLKPAPEGSAIRRCPNTSKMKELMNKHSFIPLERGLELTLNSIKNEKI